MNDRESLLRAILANRGEDTARLVYADWLEENDPSDLSKATQEFIRLSCRIGVRAKTMAPAAYNWLDENWQRLVPTIAAMHNGPPPNGGLYSNWLNWDFQRNNRHQQMANGIHWGRAGRQLQFCGVHADQTTDGHPRVRRFRMWLEFWKGFVITWRFWGFKGVIREKLYADQPLLKLNGGCKIPT